MQSETGLIRHPDNEARKRRWGYHCNWPPRWRELPEDIATLTELYQNEREEIYQGWFQAKVVEALQSLYGIAAEDMPISEVMEFSRANFFWIHDNGKIEKSTPLWAES